MGTTDARADLYTALTTAESGSRELSDRFLVEVCGVEKDPYNKPSTWKVGCDCGCASIRPDATTSVDDALAEVPEGWSYQLIRTPAVLLSSGKPVRASIKPPHEYGWADPPHAFDGIGNTLPLALCAAIVKVRENE